MEAKWGMKSKVVWLEKGVENIELFHKFSNHEKSVNTIWDMKNGEGAMVRSFKELVDLWVNHF